MPVSGEASPHHLLLTEQNCAEYDTHYKMNPPLRTQADVDALRQGIKDGVITRMGRIPAGGRGRAGFRRNQGPAQRGPRGHDGPDLHGPL